MKILVLCTGNSCRSQMAHGFLQSFDKRLKVESAGTEASGKLNERAVAVMKEIGIDISKHYSKLITDFQGKEFDYVVTVCDNAKETCPFFPAKKVIHKSFQDPSSFEGEIDDVCPSGCGANYDRDCCFLEYTNGNLF